MPEEKAPYHYSAHVKDARELTEKFAAYPGGLQALQAYLKIPPDEWLEIVRGTRMVTANTQNNMHQLLKEINNGTKKLPL